MNWFQRHLNWSLFLGIVIVPLVVWTIVLIIFGLVVYSAVSGMSDAGEEYFKILWETMVVPFYVIYILLLIAQFAFSFFVMWWYLGQKARSKWLSLLLFAPFGLIILLLLENQAIGYGGDFVSEPAADWRPDTGQAGEYYDRQWKELENRYGSGAKDASVASGKVPAETSIVAPAEAPVEIPAEAPTEIPAEAKMAEKAIMQEMPQMPILLDDAGAVIKCFYHPDGDAVNFCSRCRRYVCSQCNYVTGTHPICRHCWDKRAETPVVPVGTTAQKSVESGKSEKQRAEESERLQDFMQLYEQALPLIGAVTKKGAGGSPASPLDLMEGLKLRPMLDYAKKLPKPKSRELQEARKEFEQLLMSCIKVAETAAGFVSVGSQTVPGQAEMARLADGIERAQGLMDGLSRRVASLSQSQT